MTTERMGAKPESVDVLIVGAGHAGLAMSGLLTHEGREHVDTEGAPAGSNRDHGLPRDDHPR
jgi:cation diffusion facilitator CzcD-associated flavoprotein CzcO